MDEIVVEAGWVAEHWQDEDVQLVDVRPPHFYLQGHLPGAVNLPTFFLAAPNGAPIGAASLAQRLSSVGIARDTHVVAYDDGASPAAALLFRVLKMYTHPRISVLDGGITAWRHAGFDWEYGQAMPREVEYEPGEFDPEVLVNTEAALKLLGQDDVVFVDVRSPAEFLGLQMTAARNGHIPGAVNIDWSNNLAQATDMIKVVRPDGELRDLYAGAGVTPEKQVIVYCQSANRASETYMILKKLDYPRVSVYVPGWQEWGNRDDTPVDTP